MKSLKTILLIVFVISFASCEQNELNTNTKLIEVNFDFDKFMDFKTSVLNNITFDSFDELARGLVENNYIKGDIVITEADIQQAEELLNNLGFFEENADLNNIQENYFDFLFSNGVISYSTHNFLTSYCSNFYNSDISIIDEINYYKNHNPLTNTETIILDQISLLIDEVNRSPLCNIGCSIWGGLWGLGGSIFSPAVGFVVGVYASVTCGYVCETYNQ